MAEIRTLTTAVDSSRESAIEILEAAIEKVRSGEAMGCALVLTLPGNGIETNWSGGAPRWLLVGGLFSAARELSEGE